MRCLAQAALLILPALVSATGVSDPPVYVAVELPGEAKNLPLRLQVHASTEPCLSPNVTLGDAPLPLDGHGTITTDDGRESVIDWVFECITWRQQKLDFQFKSVDGRELSGVAFTVLFSQVTPTWIEVVPGMASMSRISPEGLGPTPDSAPVEAGQDNGESENDEENNSEMDRGIQELKTLKQEMVELEHRILEKEQELLRSFGWSDATTESCESLKCVAATIYDKMSGAAKCLYDSAIGSASGQRGHGVHHDGEEHHDQSASSHDIWAGKPSKSEKPLHHDEYSSASNNEGQEVDVTDANPSASRPLDIIIPHDSFLRQVDAKVTIGAIISLVLVIFVLHKACCSPRARAARRERLRALRRARDERRAARREKFLARREALRVLFRGFHDRIRRTFCRVGDEEKDAMAQVTYVEIQEPLPSYMPPPPPFPPRRFPIPAPAPSRSPTMEEDIAGFRAAADMVTDMVAAEEGRARRWRHMQAAQSAAAAAPTPAPRTRRPSSTYSQSSIETLPPYEESDSSVSMGTQSLVSDGFRYTPGSSGYVQSTDGADDVLGDTKS